MSRFHNLVFKVLFFSISCPFIGEACGIGSFFDSFFDYDNITDAVDANRTGNIQRLVSNEKVTPEQLNESLFQAVQKGNPDLVLTLLDCGADPLSQSVSQEFSEEKYSMVGPYVNDKVSVLTATCLVGVNALDIAEIFFDAAPNTSGMLGDVAIAGNLEVFKMLQEKGLGVEESDNNGFTPLHYAVSCGRYELVKYLLEAGANVNRTTSGDFTPLMIAVCGGYNKIAKELIKSGANTGAKTKTMLKVSISPLYQHPAIKSDRVTVPAGCNALFIAELINNEEMINEMSQQPLVKLKN
jgi:ankyrin repeat protein